MYIGWFLSVFVPDHDYKQFWKFGKKYFKYADIKI